MIFRFLRSLAMYGSCNDFTSIKYPRGAVKGDIKVCTILILAHDDEIKICRGRGHRFKAAEK